MPPVNRNQPTRAPSSESTYSLMEFMRNFPDDEACLDWLWRKRFAPDGHTAHCPSCDRERKFHKVKARPAYDCDSCGHHLHPLAGTIFHKSSTSLHLWFYAIHLITSTRCGISAKQLERELGVTYKTAWRIFNLIRNHLMSQDGEGPLSGVVEMDETFVGGKPREVDRKRRAELGWTPQTDYWERKAIVFGAVERGGRIRASVIANSRAPILTAKAREYVLPGSMIYTDEYHTYKRLGKTEYKHRRVNHSARVYVDGDVHTNTIEGFFGLFKNGVRGVYHSVSKKWLQSYLDEYVWRYNRRDNTRAMSLDLLDCAATTPSRA